MPELMINARTKLALALGFAGVFLFSGTLPATRVTVAAIDPLLLTAARASIAGIAGITVLLVLRRPIPVRAKLKQAILYIERNPKLVQSITSFPYIVKSF